MNSESRNLYTQLSTMLEDLVRVYRHLLQVVRKEKQILISANLDDLNENNRSKEAMLVKIQDIEIARQDVVKALAQKLKINNDAPKLKELAQALGGAEAERLLSFQSVLELLFKRVQEINKENEVLVNAALNNINGAMNEIKGTLADKPTYKNQGKMNEGAGLPGQLVRKQV